MQCCKAAIKLCVPLVVGVIFLTSYRHLPLWRQPVARLKSWFSFLHPATPLTRRCSFSLFRDLLNAGNVDYVTGKGFWNFTSEGVDANVDQFHPDICTFQYGKRLPRDYVADCACRSNVSYIGIIGDSNSRATFFGFVDMLQELECVRRRSFADVFSRRRCVCGEFCFVIDCSFSSPSCGGRRRLIVEHVGFYSFVKDGDPIKFGVGCNWNWSAVSGKTAPMRFVPYVPQNGTRFSLHEYMREPKPDLLIVMENSHDHYAVENHAGALENIARILDVYAGGSGGGRATTKIVWLTRIAEYARRKPMPYKTMKLHEYNNATNRISHRVLRERVLRPKSPWMMFMDHLEMSFPVQEKWSVDGVHMNETYYEHLASNIWQTFCESRDVESVG